MTDNEIIKALECCGSKKGIDSCFNCPLHKKKDCVSELQGYSFDLINRQKAEIERLKAENDVMKTNCNSMCVSMKNIAKAERTEAIKEFAERIERIPKIVLDTSEVVVRLSDLRYLLTEVTEGRKEDEGECIK